jgi:phosphoenolpyruvate carboxykinase (ATP)
VIALVTFRKGLEELGLTGLGSVQRNLPVGRLVEEALARREGVLANNGALAVQTGGRTGRSPRDRFVVRDEETSGSIWWGAVNQPMERETFDRLLARVRDHFRGKDAFVFDGFAGADRRQRLPIRVIAEKAWHALFAHTLFLRPGPEELAAHAPQFTVINACGLAARGVQDGVVSDVAVVLDLTRRLILILGTAYAGEVKKSIFAVMNYLLPARGIMTMHCAANTGAAGDTALFFGLSGTGKTTLSADPGRRLIGDDEHGWSPDGVFNFEGGCYAKCIRLSPETEPQIHAAIRFGSVVENVVIDTESRAIDYDSEAITENTRATYPVDFIPNCIIAGSGGHPKNVFFLAADAFGVLPPIARLSRPQAMYHFLSGYTAKVAGTEAGVTEPTATFSTCFGAPFMPLHPTRYATLLARYLADQSSTCWLVNTGWTGGPYGVGKRMKLPITRALLTAALDGALSKVSFRSDPTFGFDVPRSCPDVPAAVLDPRGTWSDKGSYDAKARHLAGLFAKNFEAFASEASAEVRAAGPRI